MLRLWSWLYQQSTSQTGVLNCTECRRQHPVHSPTFCFNLELVITPFDFRKTEKLRKKTGKRTAPSKIVLSSLVRQRKHPTTVQCTGEDSRYLQHEAVSVNHLNTARNKYAAGIESESRSEKGKGAHSFRFELKNKDKSCRSIKLGWWVTSSTVLMSIF